MTYALQADRKAGKQVEANQLCSQSVSQTGGDIIFKSNTHTYIQTDKQTDRQTEIKLSHSKELFTSDLCNGAGPQWQTSDQGNIPVPILQYI